MPSDGGSSVQAMTKRARHRMAAQKLEESSQIQRRRVAGLVAPQHRTPYRMPMVAAVSTVMANASHSWANGNFARIYWFLGRAARPNSKIPGSRDFGHAIAQRAWQ